MKNNIDYQEFLGRNWMIIDQYASNIKKVEVDKNTAPLEKWIEYDKSLESTPKIFEFSEKFIESAGYKPFYIYSDLMMNCIREIINKEKVKGVEPKENEKPYQWLKRIERKSKNPLSFSKPNYELWSALYKHLVKIFIDSHNDKMQAFN